MKNKKDKNKFSPLSLAQAGYITTNLFSQNDLDSHASACAFGFLLSFLPLVLMVSTILVRVAHASSEVLEEVISDMPFFETIFKVDAILSAVDFSGTFTIVQVVLGVWIFWMARNLFLYLQKGITRIFHTESPKRPVLNQVLVFAGEIILVLGAAVLVVISISLKTVKKLPLLSDLKNFVHPILLNSIFNTAYVLPYVLIFLTIFLTLKFYTGTKPSARLCFFCSVLCTGIFIGVVIFLNTFLNFKRYSLIYGILGDLVILLFEVQIFFFLFFAFAQFIFVIQFFDDLLLAELYLLPDHDKTDFINALRRSLFIRPDFLIKNFHSVKKFSEGQTIVKMDSRDDNVYYIVQGSVKRLVPNNIAYLERGEVFGETACLMNTPQKADCIAATECRVLQIPGDTFRRLIDLNGDAAKKAVKKLSVYLKRMG